MSSCAVSLNDAVSELESSLLYGDFLGQMQGILAVVQPCNLEDPVSVHNALVRLRAYGPLMEAMTRSTNAVQTIIQCLSETLPAEKLPGAQE